MNDTGLSNGASQALAGVLDARRLALHCMNLEHTLEEQRQREASLEHRITSMQQEQEQMKALAETGRNQLERLREETLSRVRATAQFTGDRERVRMVEDALKESEASPETVRSLHRAATTEFCALYPTRPLSRNAAEEAAPTTAAALTAYRMPGKSQPANVQSPKHTAAYH
ncbi:MAG: hypothetical protein P9L94_11500 [Candidatus Hinthialibacter antarcticus]|nr:hypothetical protein [Candidatus Hinthialibacter antarcticus]